MLSSHGCRAHPILADFTFDGIVTGDPQRYANVHGNIGRRSSWNLRRRQARADYTFTIHSVGEDPAQARAVGQAVLAQLIDWTPTIPGRSCFPLDHAVSQPIFRDPDANPAVWYGVDQFDLSTLPA
jgi:hypothetical protein